MWRQTETEKLFISQTEQKLLRVCTAATCIWFISWTPYAVIFLLPMLGGRHLVSPSLDMVPAVFSKLAAAINPIIYGLLWVDMTSYNIDDDKWFIRMPKFVLCAKRLFGRRPSRGTLVRNVRCLRRKRALSDTFFELGSKNLDNNWYKHSCGSSL